METEIEKSITESIKSDLTEIKIDVLESLPDGNLEDGLIKDIPFLGSVYKLYKSTLSFREIIFIKKVLKFLLEVDKIPLEKRQEFIDKIEADNKYRSKVGEKLMLILDKLDDHDKLAIVAKLFVAAVVGKLSYEEFLRLAGIVEKAHIPDLQLVKSKPMFGLGSEVEQHLYSIGLMDVKIDIVPTNKSYSGSNSNFQQKFGSKISYKLNRNAQLIVSIGLSDE